MNKILQINNNLETLQLIKMKELLNLTLDRLSDDSSYSVQDALMDLTNAEISFKDERARRINIAVSSFPFFKTLNDFDFSFQPAINKTKIIDLATLRFMDNKTNIVFMGSPGVGKTHLATAIGIEAASQRQSTYFINFAVLMEKFKTASKENRVEQVVKHYLKYTLLIIDEIGYLPVDKNSSYGFFQLIAARYEKKSTILTTNQPFTKWAEVFGDSFIANAILDRLLHHCEVIKINGLSYRMKDINIYEEDA